MREREGWDKTSFERFLNTLQSMYFFTRAIFQYHLCNTTMFYAQVDVELQK